MSKPTDYSWITAHSMQLFRQQQAAEEAAQKPRLALVTTNERISSMDTPNDPTHAARALPLHKNGAFDELYGATRLIDLGADAMRGIAAMMRPTENDCDDQLENTRRSDMYAIFQFFSEALKEPAMLAADSAERLQRAARGEVS